MYQKHLLYIICIIHCSFATLNAQNDYRKGYILTLNQDTVFGEIRFRGDMANSLKCTFKDNTGFIRDYKPDEIKSYRYLNGKYYISKIVKNDNATVNLFAEYLVQGKKNLYYYRNNSGTHFLIDFINDTLTEIPYHEDIVKIEDVNYLKTSTLHIGYLKTYFNDCPAVFDEIDKISKPYFENLVKLTKNYHHFVCKDSGCIVYYKPERPLRFGIEPVFGISDLRRMNSGIATEKGVYIYLWLPRSNENLYFKTGIFNLKDTILFNNSNFSIDRIPFDLEYLFPYKIIKPKVDFGINAYYFQTLMSISTSIGFLIKAKDHIFFDLSFSSDLMNLSLQPHFFISHSFEFGLLFKM